MLSITIPVIKRLEATIQMVEDINKKEESEHGPNSMYGPYVIALNASDCQYYFDRIVHNTEGYNDLYSCLFKLHKIYILNNPFSCPITQFRPFLTRDDLVDKEYCGLLMTHFNDYVAERVTRYSDMFGCLKKKEEWPEMDEEINTNL